MKMTVLRDHCHFRFASHRPPLQRLPSEEFFFLLLLLKIECRSQGAGPPGENYQPRPLSTRFMSVSPRWNLPRFSDRIDQCRSVVSCEAAEVWGVMTRFGAVHSGSP